MLQILKKLKYLWNRRKSRLNGDRIFVKLSLPAHNEYRERYLADFDRITFPKICFYSGENDINMFAI